MVWVKANFVPIFFSPLILEETTAQRPVLPLRFRTDKLANSWRLCGISRTRLLLRSSALRLGKSIFDLCTADRCASSSSGPSSSQRQTSVKRLSPKSSVRRFSSLLCRWCEQTNLDGLWNFRPRANRDCNRNSAYWWSHIYDLLKQSAKIRCQWNWKVNNGITMIILLPRFNILNRKQRSESRYSWIWSKVCSFIKGGITISWFRGI